MLKQAQELKSKLDKAQKELNDIIVEADAGKGAVKVTMNCQQKILSVKISPQVIDPNKAEHPPKSTKRHCDQGGKQRRSCQLLFFVIEDE